MQICLSPGRETENLFGVALNSSVTRMTAGENMKTWCSSCLFKYNSSKQLFIRCNHSSSTAYPTTFQTLLYMPFVMGVVTREQAN